MNILSIKGEDLRVVFDGLMVLTQLGIAVGSVIQSLDVLRDAILKLIRVVLYSFAESLHFSVNEASVGVDDWVAGIKQNCLIKVVNRVLKSTEK